ncbi:MAG: hypothetical protein M0Z55_04640 [Peptococcaceae bacterium]|nr:hypothetical protein [Peptococcaceae bacterium]
MNGNVFEYREVLVINNFRSQLRIGLVLIISSAVLYSLQILLFHSPRDTAFYLFQDLAFVPIQVILVTLLLDTLLTAREKQEKLLKLNTVISAFFSEVGSATIALMAASNLNLVALQECLKVNPDWSKADFNKASGLVEEFELQIKCTTSQLERLKKYLGTKKPYMLRMFDNPNLLEHDTFTDMQWALYHVLDELESRESLEGLPGSDLTHLSNDIVRAFRLLLIEWVSYMKYLKNDYPYLFSLAIRKNPFEVGRSVIIED